MHRVLENCQLYSFILPVLDSNMYILLNERKALIIDPFICKEAGELLKSNKIDNIVILLTHEHIDHISGVNWIREISEQKGYDCTVYCSNACKDRIIKPEGNLAAYFYALIVSKTREEAELLSKYFSLDYMCSADVGFDGHLELKWSDWLIVLREMPGHSQGSICVEIYDEKGDKLLALITGDSLIKGNRVITKLPGGSKDSYKEIVQPYLESFSDNTLVLPGHGEIGLMKEFRLG